MQKLISIFFFGLVLFSFTISSCNKDKDTCSDPKLTENIVGKWKVAVANSLVEFKSDGTVVDVDDVIISGESNGTAFTVKTYTVTGDDKVKLKAALEDGSSFAEVEFTVTTNDCDKLVLALPSLGVSMTLERQ